MGIEKSHGQNPRPHNSERSESMVGFSGHLDRIFRKSSEKSGKKVTQ